MSIPRPSATRPAAILAALAALASIPPLLAQDAAPVSGADLRRAASAPFGQAAAPAAGWRISLPSDLGPKSATPAIPAPSGALGVDEAVALALRNNLGLAGERLEVAVKKRKSDNSWNQFLPTVDVSATLGRWNDPKTLSGLAPIGSPDQYGRYNYVAAYSFDYPAWTLSASLSAQVVLNPALIESMKGAKLDYEAGLISYSTATRKLERDVRKSFYGILLLQENMKLMEENIGNAKRRVDQAEANYRAGVVPELTFLSARVAYENLKPALEEMRVGYASSLDGFAILLGLPRGGPLALAGSIKPAYGKLDAERLVSERLPDRLDVQALVKTLEGLKSQERELRSRVYAPNLVLGWNFDPAFMGDPFKDNLTKGNSTMTQGGDAWQQQSGMLRATVLFRLNGLLPQSQEAQGLAALRDGIERARSGLALTIRGAETEIDSLVRKLEKSRGSQDALQLNVDLAAKAYRLADEAYKAGARDLLEVQSAELEMRKAQLQALAESYTYVTGLLDLEYAVNVPFGSLGASGVR